MKKTKFTKSLAFKTMLRLLIITTVISLFAAAIIGAVSFVNLVLEMRDATYEAALKGSSIASVDMVMKDGIDKYFETGKTDEAYDDLWLNLILITDDFSLQRCDIFVPHEDHITYLISTEDEKSGDSLKKEAPYYGEEKDYVQKAMEAVVEEEFDPDKSQKKVFYAENVKDGVEIFTYYMPLIDANKKPLTKSVRTMKDSVKEGQVVNTDIHTGDEIEELATAFEDMNRDLIGYIDENTRITAEKERIDTELNLATNIQAGMLPDKFPAFPDRKDFDIYASMTPAKEVGGDFYDFFLIDENRLGIVMADVSGKGVPAALFMMHSKILLKSYTLMKQTPKAALEEVNRQICENNPEDMFVTVWLGVLDLKTGVFTAANAGHEKPAVKQPGGSFELYMDKHGIMVGYMDSIRYRKYELTLEKGSKLFLYTDGVAEATNAQEELFGTDRMIEALRTAEDKSPKDILAAVNAAVDEFVGEAPQFDDLTMLCIEYNGEAEA